MEKNVDKESLLDTMFTLKTKAGIDNKDYRLWFKLNEDTRISVRTSVGESDSKLIKNSLGGPGIITKYKMCQTGHISGDVLHKHWDTATKCSSNARRHRKNE